MLLQLEGLGRRFGAVWAFRALSLCAERGEVISLVGPNGAGKTTLLKVLSTLLTPSEGRGVLDGHCLAASPAKVRAAVAWVPATERGFFARLTGLQNLRFHAGLLGLGKKTLQQRISGLGESPTLEAALKTPYYLGSAGMRQSLHLARALLAQPRVLLLDEPTRSLDGDTRRQMWALFQAAAQQSLVILASHSPEEIAVLGARQILLKATA